MDIGTKFREEHTPWETVNLLRFLFGNDDKAMSAALLIKSQLPMYDGVLSEKWKYWDDVTKAIYPIYEGQPPRKTIEPFFENIIGWWDAELKEVYAANYDEVNKMRHIQLSENVVATVKPGVTKETIEALKASVEALEKHHNS